MTLAVLALAIVFADSALACRCAPQPLATYFGNADVVAMARLNAAQPNDDDIGLTFELLGDAYKGTLASGEEITALTASTSASCGVPAEIGAVYVVFAAKADGGLRVDSCSGTRVHFSETLAEPRGFEDVPARFVARQLIALQGLEALRQVAAAAPRPGNPANETLIGLLDLKALAHGGATAVRRAPQADAAVVATIDSYAQVLSRELDYELPAAVVYARLPGWYRVQTSTVGYAWVAASEAGTFFSYDTLPVRRLAYLTREWSGLVWPGPGSGLPLRAFSARRSQPAEQAVNVLESTSIGGMPWFRIELLDVSPCSRPDARARLAGWVPGYGISGKPTAWFYSRGC